VLVELAEETETIQQILEEIAYFELKGAEGGEEIADLELKGPRAVRRFPPTPWTPVQSLKGPPTRSAQDWGYCYCSSGGSPEPRTLRSAAPARRSGERDRAGRRGPRRKSAYAGELVAAAGVLLLGGEQLQAGGQVLLGCFGDLRVVT
jgi:hypothetical protein